MSSGRTPAQVAAALRRTGSVPKEKTTNAPIASSGDKSPASKHAAKSKGTPESEKPAKLPKTKTPPKKGAETTQEGEANSEEELLFGPEEPTRGRPPPKQRVTMDADKGQKLPKTNVAKTKSPSRGEGRSIGRGRRADDELPSGDEAYHDDVHNVPKLRSKKGSDGDDAYNAEEDRQFNEGGSDEDGNNEELDDDTRMPSRDNNQRKKPMLDKSRNISLQDSLHIYDDDLVRKKRARNKPYSNDKKVPNDALKKRKHFDKPNQLKGGRRPKKKTKKYSKSDDDNSSSEKSSSDDDHNFRNDSSLPDSDATAAADYTLLECFMRQAIHYFSPSSQYKKPVMYWSTKVSTAAAHMLVERHAHEIPNLFERYGGQTALEMRFGKKLRFLANNERAIQTRQIKNTYLSKQNPETRLAENLLETELDLDESSPIRIHKNISHIKSIAELQELLVSPKMYQDQILFDIFCLGLESGNFRQNRKRPYTPLNDLITKAHEAHFRVELYLALSKKSFRHHNVHSASAERVRLFNIAISAVREGRQKYLKKAVETRMKSRTQRQVNECERVGELEENSDDYVDVEEDDL